MHGAWPLLIPIVAIDLLLLALALVDLCRRERRVKGGKKWVWGVVIVVLGILGPLVYFIAGRDEEDGERHGGRHGERH